MAEQIDTRTDASGDTVAAVRRFNRFYTRAIGVLDRGHLGGPYTLVGSPGTELEFAL